MLRLPFHCKHLDLARTDLVARLDRQLALTAVAASDNKPTHTIPSNEHIQSIRHDLAMLATLEGHEHLLDAAANAGLDLAALSIEDSAVRAYLEHPTVFRQASARARRDDIREFVEYRSMAPCHWDSRDSETRRESFRHMHEAWLDRRYGTSACTAVSEMLDCGHLMIQFARRGPLRRVESQEAPVEVQDVQIGILLHDEVSNSLLVCAPSRDECDACCQGFGEAYYHNSTFFTASPAYSAQPIVDLGAASFSASRDPEYSAVRLQAIKFVSSLGCPRWIELCDANLSSVLSEPYGQCLLAEYEIFSFLFEFESRTTGKTTSFEITTPNRIRFDPFQDYADHFAFLTAHGFRL